MDRKSILMALLARGQQHLDELAGGLTTEERSRQGAVDHWSIKDIVGHIAFWQGVACRDLAGQPREPLSDEDAVNAAIFEGLRRRTWEESRAEARAVAQVLRDLLESLTEEQLDGPDPHPLQESQPLWRRLQNDAFGHPIGHLAGWYVRQGQTGRALSLFQAGMPLLRALDDGPEWQGVLDYDLACMHALNGDKPAAVALLAAAVRQNPAAADWAREDRDLECLRGEPACSALF